MGLRGPKPKYENPENLSNAIDAYFSDCERKGVFPDYAGMKLYIRMSESTIKNYQADGHKDFMRYREIFETARDRRESWLVRRMTTEPKAAQGCLNALKQKANGGYTDRPTEERDRSLTINLIGVGGEKAFK